MSIELHPLCQFISFSLRLSLCLRLCLCLCVHRFSVLLFFFCYCPCFCNYLFHSLVLCFSLCLCLPISLRPCRSVGFCLSQSLWKNLWVANCLGWEETPKVPTAMQPYWIIIKTCASTIFIVSHIFQQFWIENRSTFPGERKEFSFVGVWYHGNALLLLRAANEKKTFHLFIDKKDK